MSQKRNRKPAFDMLIGCGEAAAVCMKKGIEPSVRASSPFGFSPLFQFASQTRGAMLRGLPLWYGLRLGGYTSSASPQGEGCLLDCKPPKGFPLRGSSAEGGDEV